MRRRTSIRRGWTTEVVIPFKTLNFDPQNSEWGLTIQRNIQRNQESIAWVSYNRQVNPGTTGIISGFTGLQQGRGLDVVPTVVASGSREFETDSADSSMEPSLDVFYNFTPSLTGVLTLNTDFSATEVDDRQINLTRFNLFFPERNGISFCRTWTYSLSAACGETAYRSFPGESGSAVAASPWIWMWAQSSPAAPVAGTSACWASPWTIFKT